MADVPPTRANGARGKNGATRAGDPPGGLTVVGLGAMGGSVALAMLERFPGTRVFGVEPNEDSAARAAEAGVRIAARLEDCDVRDGLVVFATPIDVTMRLLREKAATWRRAAFAMDVASLKLPVEFAARRALRQPLPSKGAFVGSHPMCGTERSGFAAARADLFENARVWICPIHTHGLGAGTFWALLGARPSIIDSDDHDELMVQASHLPQLLATALAATLDDAGVKRSDLGPGGRDMTRLSASSPEMWLPLLKMARAADARALGRVEEWVGRLRGMLEAGDMKGVEALMRKGGEWASREE